MSVVALRSVCGTAPAGAGSLRRRSGSGRPRLVRRAAPTTGSERKFADFLQFEEPGGDEQPQQQPPAEVGSQKAEELVDRAASLLAAAREALETVRQRDPADSRNRRSGKGIRSSTTSTLSSQDVRGGGRSAADAAAAAAPQRTFTSFVWEAEEEEEGDNGAGPGSGGASSSGRAFGGLARQAGGFSLNGGGSSDGGGGGGDGSWSQSGLDSWFGDKVDTGPVQLRRTMQPMAAQASPVAVLDRPAGPATLEFAAPEAPESAGPSIFPAEMQLHFQAPEAEAAAALPEAEADVAAPPSQAAAEAPAEAPQGNWERRSGEETGPHGYWYRWTEVRGCDESGEVQWYEKWWEASDWRGMKEMGAEKWGCNARGDAWRETWREAIVVEHNANQPSVERSAHKWAKSGAGNEWEEKWGERYFSGGRAEKWADKWGREGADVWHEKWGESYDGAGGCVKWTDKWAERELLGGAREQWGDKWEENFAGGRGTKTGETWSISGGGERYNRWWGENHLGDRLVQKYGNSSTGEHWDVTETMDTYYNPVPHFGYDLALSHSPTLRGVPTLPRDRGTLRDGLSPIL